MMEFLGIVQPDEPNMRFRFPAQSWVGWLALAGLCLAWGSFAGAEPLRLPDGEPLVCIYYFPHWWEPWKSSDEAVLRDFRRLRRMGFNTLLVDHEWSQAIDGNWRWLDRSHRLAAQAGLKILPWLSAKSWSDIYQGDRARLAKQWFGVEIPYGASQDGRPASPLIYDDAVISAGSQYALRYLERYSKAALVRVRWKGKARPVVSLSVESAWIGGFGARSAELFRKWLAAKYGEIGKLNARWGTSLGSFSAVDPRDVKLFDYSGHVAARDRHPAAVEDHVAFRAEMTSKSLARMAARVRARWPEVLFLAEVPYQYGAEHPDAKSYRITYGANPESCDYADIVLFRCTGPLSGPEAQSLKRHRRRTGQRFVLTYRTYSDWDVRRESDAFFRSVKLYADQAAALGDGFGFYSFNEMVDTHLAYSPAMGAGRQHGWSPERAERAMALVEAMVRRYRDEVGTQ
jgi:Beta-galactosidase